VKICVNWYFNTRYVTTTLEEQAKTFMTRDKRGENSPLIPDEVDRFNFDRSNFIAEGVALDIPYCLWDRSGAYQTLIGQFTGTVRTGARWAAPGSARRMPMKVRRKRKDRLLCVSVASM